MSHGLAFALSGAARAVKFHSMRRLFMFLVLATLLPVAGVHAQLTVRVRMLEDTVLTYESIWINVSIRNYSGRTIDLRPGGEKPWLNFVITDENGSLVRAVGSAMVEGQTLIPPGETVTRAIDLLPLYDLRARGGYRVRARVISDLATVESEPARFSIINGRDVTSQTVGLPPKGSGPDEYRKYSLFVKQGPERGAKMYLCVQDELHQLIYGMLPLGNYLPLVEPEMRTDRDGDVHVLFQSGPRAFVYAHVTAAGKALQRTVYSDMMSRPQLVAQNRIVSVRGGEQVYPRTERVMTEEELNPPPPPPPPKKKHWWWPFGPSTNATTNRVARPSVPVDQK